MAGAHRWTFSVGDRLGGKKLFDLQVDPTGTLFLVVDDKSRVVMVSPTGEQLGDLFGASGTPASYDRLTGLSISASRGVMMAVDQKDLVVQEIRAVWPDETAFLEPAPRAFAAFAIDTIQAQVLAVSPGPEGTDDDERWLARDGGGLAIFDPTGDRVGEVVLAELPKPLVTMGMADGFVLVGADRSMRVLSRTGQVEISLPAAFQRRAKGPHPNMYWTFCGWS